MNLQLQTQQIPKITPHPSQAPIARGLLQRKCACGRHTTDQHGQCTECRKKRMSLQRRAMNENGPETAPPIVHEVLRSPGRPLDPTTRAFMEPRFGRDFSGVRIHTNERAAESAQAVNALAYTVGQHIAFGSGQYAPGTRGGRRLLAHELAHVVQQRQSTSTSSATLKIASSSSSEESEAMNNEHAIHKNIGTVGIVLQRHDDPNQYLGGTNAVFDSQGEARMAALAEATALGPGHTITHDPMPARGLPHYHVVDPAGHRVRGHFFYRTRRRRRNYKIDWSAVRDVVITLGLSLAMIAVIIAALADPEPASKLALAGLSAAMITIVLGRLSGEDAGDDNSA